jgi:hypothetical protein
MADSLFDNNDTDSDDIDYFTELTKPGGKFDRSKYSSDEELMKALAKGKYHGDKLLDLKLQETDQMREDYMKVLADNRAMSKYEDLIKRLENNQNANTPPASTDNQTQQLDQSKIDELIARRVQETIQSFEAQKAEASNLAVVESRLKERFGAENAKKLLRERMNSTGLTAEDLKFLAKKSPEAAINALGLNQPQGHDFTPPSSNIRSDSFKPNVEIRDAVYYDKLRRENPKEYYSEKTSLQKLKDMDHPDFTKRWDQVHNTQFGF